MASGPSSQGSHAPAGAPPAVNDANLSPKPSVNSESSVAMPATELVAHNKRHRRTSESSFADVAPVLAAREHRLVEAKELVRERRAENHALQQPRAAGDAKPRAPRQPRAANTKKPRTVKKTPYKSARMSAPVGFQSYYDDESEGDTMSEEGEVPVGASTPTGSSKDKGEIGNNVPRHASLRMNASTTFEDRFTRQAKQPRRRS